MRWVNMSSILTVSRCTSSVTLVRPKSEGGICPCATALRPSARSVSAKLSGGLGNGSPGKLKTLQITYRCEGRRVFWFRGNTAVLKTAVSVEWLLSNRSHRQFHIFSWSRRYRTEYKAG